MGIFNRNKKIIIYALAYKNVKNKFITLVKNKAEAYEYMVMLLRIQHQAHFYSWCELRELDKHDNKN